MRLRRRHLAAATAALAATWPVHALELGALRLLSQRGEPLRAEVELLQLSPQDAATLKLSVAPQTDFSQHQLVWSPLLGDLQLSQRHNPDGSTTLLLRSSQPVQLPAFDLMLRADWSGGGLFKAYTVVLPSSRAELAGVAQPLPAPSYTVKRGDTLSAIAAGLPQAGQFDPAQLLVALEQSNPDAFVDHNANRMLAGAVLRLPSTAAVAAVDPAVARQTLQAQATDFDAWREQLALRARALDQPRSAQRTTSGQVQAEVHAPAAAAPQDRLKLTQAAATSRAAAEAGLIAAQQQSLQLQQQLHALDTRVAALSKLLASASAATAASRPHAAPAALGGNGVLRQWLAPLAGIVMALFAALLWLRRGRGRPLSDEATPPIPDFARQALALDLNLGKPGSVGDDADAAALQIDLAGFDDQAPANPVPPRPLFDLSSISLELEPEEPPASGVEASADPCPASRSD